MLGVGLSTTQRTWKWALLDTALQLPATVRAAWQASLAALPAA